MVDLAAQSLRDLMENSELQFDPPLRFEFAQSSDETGEYYTRTARFVDASGHVIIDLVAEDGWCDVQMRVIAKVLSEARKRYPAKAECE